MKGKRESSRYGNSLKNYPGVNKIIIVDYLWTRKHYNFNVASSTINVFMQITRKREKFVVES